MDIVYLIWLRAIKRLIRSPGRLVMTIVMPFALLLVLGVGLNDVVQLPGIAGSYIVFLVPGMVTMTVMFTAVGYGVQILWDKQFGFLKVMLVAPVSRLEIVTGQTAGGATMAIFQGLVILAPALLIGFAIPNLPGFCLAVLFMCLVAISFTAFGIALASRMGDMTGFQMLMNFVVFPIFALSGAIFPISTLPPWIEPLTLIDPLTYGVEGIRYGLTGISQIHPVICLAVMAGFSAVTTFAGAYLFRKIQ